MSSSEKLYNYTRRSFKNRMGVFIAADERGSLTIKHNLGENIMDFEIREQHFDQKRPPMINLKK